MIHDGVGGFGQPASIVPQSLKLHGREILGTSRGRTAQRLEQANGHQHWNVVLIETHQPGRLVNAQPCVDLAIRNLPAKKWDDAAIRSLLESAASVDLQDGFEFTISAPTKDLDASPYGGSRFPVEAQMAGRRFASFHLDVSERDVLREPFEILEGQDWLGFAGIARAKLPAVSREEQFAEKLHAYTLPRTGRPNTRVKDLVDMVLLFNSGTMEQTRLAENIKATFRRRGTHDLPATLPPPQANWEATFGEMAAECDLDNNMTEYHRRLAGFLAGVLK